MPSAPRHTVVRRSCCCTAPGQTEPTGRPHRCDGWMASVRAKRKKEVGQSRAARGERSECPGPTAAHGTPCFDVVALPLVLVAPDRNLRCVEGAWSNQVRQRPLGACPTVSAHRGDASRTGRIERAPGIDAGQASPVRGARRGVLQVRAWQCRSRAAARQRAGPCIASPAARDAAFCGRAPGNVGLRPRPPARPPARTQKRLRGPDRWLCGSPALRLSGFQPTFTASSLAE